MRVLDLGIRIWVLFMSSKFCVKELDSGTVENQCLKFSSEFSVLSLY